MFLLAAKVAGEKVNVKRGSGQSDRGGFTLVELAIGMAIIGLLIGGILKGQEMLRNARMSATIRDINAIDAAFSTFLDTYDQKPGDMVNATSRIPDCTTCSNGDGNGIIGKICPVAGPMPIVCALTSQAGFTSVPEIETMMFWTHLLHADLITSITGGDPADPNWGTTHPASHLEGGIHIGYMTSGLPFFPTVASAHYLGFRKEIHAPGILNKGMGALSPYDALIIDQKMDDGRPLTGYVVFGGGPGSLCDASGMLGSWDAKSRADDCGLFARVGPK